MAYILKNSDGKIVAISQIEMLEGGWERVEENSSEYLQFLEDSLAINSPFYESDMQLVRVIEDVISLLIERSIIRFTDLPTQAQKRLNERGSMRKKTNLNNLVDDLVGDNEEDSYLP